MRNIILSLIFIFIIFGISCRYEKNKLYINTDRESYKLSSSSEKGLLITPKIELSKDLKNIELQYKWTASSGGFIESNSGNIINNLINTGESVIWTALSDNSEDIPEEIEIEIEAIRKEDDKIIAKNKLKVIRKEDIYKVTK